MQILLDDNKISNFSFTQEGMHTLGCQHLNEVFFDIFEIKNKDFQLIKEKKGEVNGKPIVEVDLFIDNVLYKNVQFVLNEQSKTSINKNLLRKLKNSLEKKSTNNLVTENVESYDSQALDKQLVESVKRDLLKQLKDEIVLNLENNIDSLFSDTTSQNKLQKYLLAENNKFRKELIEVSEKIARRESLRITESGGGTNATQYANGGTINGTLNIDGALVVNGQNAVKIFTVLLGDGTNNTFTVNHALNSTNIIANVQDMSTGEIVLPYLKVVDSNNIRVDFSFVPPTDSYKLIIVG